MTTPKSPRTTTPAPVAPKGRKPARTRDAGTQRAIRATQPLAEQPKPARKARKPRGKGGDAGQPAAGAVRVPFVSVPTALPNDGVCVCKPQQFAVPLVELNDASVREDVGVAPAEAPVASVSGVATSFESRSDGTLGGAPDSVNELLRDGVRRAGLPFMELKIRELHSVAGGAVSTPRGLLARLLTPTFLTVVSLIALAAAEIGFVIYASKRYPDSLFFQNLPKAPAVESVPAEPSLLSRFLMDIDDDAVLSVLASVRVSVQDLYSQAFSLDSSIKGVLKVKLDINPNGTVKRVNVESKDASIPQSLVDAISGELRALSFPVSSVPYCAVETYTFVPKP
ncbi:hypothetical protein HY992_01945 [Candidatus Micrarchaeota archaeon]|nr:hypothetical protein [Candidatus Micrarchaeota archaeon]